MSDAPVRKHVKPAHEGARIPDPAHRGRFLPAAGLDVVWDHYWINREQQGDVVVSEVANAAD